jgi:hypothetical protein
MYQGQTGKNREYPDFGALCLSEIKRNFTGLYTQAQLVRLNDPDCWCYFMLSRQGLVDQMKRDLKCHVRLSVGVSHKQDSVNLLHFVYS